MDHKDIAAQLHRDLQNAGAQTKQRFRNIGLAALGRNCQRGEADGLCPFRELLEFL